MTASEFKAWFDGFTEALTGCPTNAQWTRIKARVAEIDGNPVTERVYVDRYGQYRYPYWGNTCYAFGTSNAIGSNQIGSGGPALQEMNDLGRAEAAEIGGISRALG